MPEEVLDRPRITDLTLLAEQIELTLGDAAIREDLPLRVLQELVTAIREHLVRDDESVTLRGE